ncbi:hypothetical protein R1flu_026374 [Riccia fluitans]|uniref:Aminotransferase class V domain-containing protein n=1 Tax=Riccia fluitans TaxID=41844 RepID=A0ABD1XIP7_9MARC
MNSTRSKGSKQIWKSKKKDGHGIEASFSYGAEAVIESEEEFPPCVEIGSPERKLQWLRSQIIGNNTYCVTPFGRRPIHYADHTASGKSLIFIEKYILQHVLPFYGNTHTYDSFVGQRTSHLVEECSAYVKMCLGGTESDEIFFCGTGSTAAIKKLQDVMGLTVSPPLREQTLQTLEESRKWVVFVGPYEHHSNLLSWRQSLAEVVEISLNEEGSIDMGELQAALQDPKYKNRPKLGSFSACSNVTGIVTDTRTIAKLLRENGSFACFDFAASGPYVEIDMRSGEADGYDAVFLSPHKFMGGPGSCGVLLMTKKLYLLGTGPPSMCAGGTVFFSNHNYQDSLYFSDLEQREDAGTPGIIQKVRTALTFWVKELIGTDLISSRETHFVDTAMSRLSSIPNLNIYGGTKLKRIAILSFTVDTTSSFEGVSEFEPDEGLSGSSSPSLSGAELNGMCSPLRVFTKGRRQDFLNNNMNVGFYTGGDPRARGFSSWRNDDQLAPSGKPLHGRFITKLLNDLFGIQGRGGCSCAGPYSHPLLGIDDELSFTIRQTMAKGRFGIKPGWARVSFGFYITDEDFEFLLTAIEFIAAYGQRFLRLYDFDWETGDWSFKGEYKSMVEAAEKQVVSKVKNSWWSSRTPDLAQLGCLSLNSTSSQVLVRKLHPHQTTILHIALRIAESLPEQIPLRDIPDFIDPESVIFRV